MWVLRCANLAHGHNAIFGLDGLGLGMIRGALPDASVGGCAKAQMLKDDGVPTDRWFASKLKGIPLRLIQAAFEERAARQYDIFKLLKKVPKEGLTMAVDMHLIPRYDGEPGEELTRSRYKLGTKYFERYLTVHHVNAAMRMVLGSVTSWAPGPGLQDHGGCRPNHTRGADKRHTATRNAGLYKRSKRAIFFVF